tara:strand:- start:926 stop:1264 length:339 start_codon:yes stop_codon:yes gene_type:complete
MFAVDHVEIASRSNAEISVKMNAGLVMRKIRITRTRIPIPAKAHVQDVMNAQIPNAIPSQFVLNAMNAGRKPMNALMFAINAMIVKALEDQTVGKDAINVMNVKPLTHKENV